LDAAELSEAAPAPAIQQQRKNENEDIKKLLRAAVKEGVGINRKDGGNGYR
jgi:hypothetical protein